MKRLRPDRAGCRRPAACSPAPNILPVNDLNRPTDIAFMCLGAFSRARQPTAARLTRRRHQVSGRPMQACHPQDE